MDLRFTELMPAAQIVTEECMQIKPEEKVLVVTDTRIPDYFGTEPLVQALTASLKLIGCDPCLMTWTARAQHGMHIPALAEDTLMAADAVICVNTGHFIQDPILWSAVKQGARIMVLPGGYNVERVDDMIYRAFPKTKAEYEEIRDLTIRIGNLFIGGRKTVHVTSQKGTDVTFDISDDFMQSVCSGECFQKGRFSSIPAGQLAFGVVPGTAKGTIVIDASIHPIKRILETPITFQVADGNFTSIDGGIEAREFREVVDKCPYPGKFNIAEFGMGCNPITKIIGNSFEDECYYGSGHIGFGSNTSFGGDIFTDNWHCDGVFLHATVEIDGKVICKDGEFIF